MLLLRLGELRRLKGVSQAEMAKALHVNQTAISQWERNVYYPSCDKLPEIAQLFGCTIDELFEEVG